MTDNKYQCAKIALLASLPADDSVANPDWNMWKILCLEEDVIERNLRVLAPRLVLVMQKLHEQIIELKNNRIKKSSC